MIHNFRDLSIALLGAAAFFELHNEKLLGLLFFVLLVPWDVLTATAGEIYTGWQERREAKKLSRELHRVEKGEES